MESSILQKIGIDPAYILIGMLVLIIALFVLLFILMGNIKNRNKQIKRLLSGTQAGDLEDIIMKRFAEMDAVKNSLSCRILSGSRSPVHQNIVRSGKREIVRHPDCRLQRCRQTYRDAGTSDTARRYSPRPGGIGTCLCTSLFVS